MLDLRYLHMICRSAEYLQLYLKVTEDVPEAYSVQVNAVAENQL